MRISFIALHPYWSQLNNNGGTHTIVRSAFALQKLGHAVSIVCKKNKYTWGPVPQVTSVIPPSDAYIAATPSDVQFLPNTRSFLWLRGLHYWSHTEKELVKICKSVRTLVNASHLHSRLKKLGVDSQVCFSGLDLNFYDGKRHSGEYVGCLRGYKRGKDYRSAKRIIKKAGKKKLVINKKPYKNMNMDRMKEFYGKCNIWLNTFRGQGFNNVAAEAALSGCLVVSNESESNGAMDWVSPETALIYRSKEEAIMHLKYPDYSKVEKAQAVLKEKIGDRKRNMERLVECLKSYT